MTDLFSPNGNQATNTDPVINGSYRELLVGEGKKFKDDEALAKGKLEGDRHITTLEAELATLRTELNKRKTLEEVVEQIKSARVQPDSGNNQKPIVPETPSDAGINNKDDILKLVNQTINQQKTIDQARLNVETVRSELHKVWGDAYPEKLAQATKELEVSKEFLASMAETNPKAFLKVVQGAVPPRAGDPNISSPPRNSATPSANNLVQGTFKTYMEEQKKNPKLRYDRDYQAKLHREALENPDHFFR